MTDDLHARLLAAVRQRMETAQAATPGEWEDRNDDVITFIPGRAGYRTICGGAWTMADAEHIAANDPATIIRHCERDLRVLERHAVAGGICPLCAPDQRVVEDAEDGATYWEFRPIDWPCDEITDLCSAYGVEVT